MSQKTKSGHKGSLDSPNAIVIVSLIVGAIIIGLLLYLRSNKSAHPANGSTQSETSAEAEKLGLPKYKTEEIQKWIASRMQVEGAKIGVVNVWATWCEPCRDEMPELAKYQKTKQAPLFLISADNEVDEKAVRSFLVQSGVDFESALIKGNQQEFIEKWQNLSSKDPARQWSMTLPATFLVNASGQILSFHVGTSTVAELTALVKKTLDTAHD